MTLLQEAARKISAIQDPGTRDKFVRALKSSAVWDGVEDDRLPSSAESIASASGLGPAALETNHVFLSKTDLPAYGQEHGIEKSLTAIRKSLTATTYESHFNDGRKAVRNGRKLLLTYAEARSILNVRVKGAMPPL